ncbi:MAG: endonuclease V [Candidatus Bipolaricaulaceae bacterium]
MAAVADIEVPDLEQLLARLIRQIPPGKVTTYRALGEALGDRTAARFVGKWLMEPPVQGLPAHRVVHASGDVGRMAFATSEEKARLLAAEGVRVVGGKVDPLPRYFFWEFATDRPLARLQREQQEIAGKVVLTPLVRPRSVAALDVAYRDRVAVAAFVYARPDGEAVDFVTAEAAARFPYVPTYLTWRELPAYVAAVQRAEAEGLIADVLLVDGCGILHPRRTGIATHLGVVLDRPTVGVAKRRLCGEVNAAGQAIGEWRPVVLEGDTVGAAIRTGRNRTLFVSPGHRSDLATAVELVLGMTESTSYPAPLAMAHELATEAARGDTGASEQEAER